MHTRYSPKRRKKTDFRGVLPSFRGFSIVGSLRTFSMFIRELIPTYSWKRNICPNYVHIDNFFHLICLNHYSFLTITFNIYASDSWLTSGNSIAKYSVPAKPKYLITEKTHLEWSNQFISFGGSASKWVEVAAGASSVVRTSTSTCPWNDQIFGLRYNSG